VRSGPQRNLEAASALFSSRRIGCLSYSTFVLQGFRVKPTPTKGAEFSSSNESHHLRVIAASPPLHRRGVCSHTLLESHLFWAPRSKLTTPGEALSRSQAEPEQALSQTEPSLSQPEQKRREVMCTNWEGEVQIGVMLHF